MVCEMDVEVATVAEPPADGIKAECDVTNDVTNALDLTCPNKVDNQVTSYSSLQVTSMSVLTHKRGRVLSLGKEKTYVCGYKVCAYKTKYKNAMKRHIETQHLALVHHVCPVCHKSFKHQDNLSKHVKIHKKDERCPLCHRVFALKQQLRQHLQNKHSVDPDYYLKNNTMQMPAVHPNSESSFQSNFNKFVMECEKQNSQSIPTDHKAPGLFSTTENLTPISEMSTEMEASDLSTTYSSASTGPFPDSHSVNPSQFVSSAISESIVREAVLQNPNLSLKQDPGSHDDYAVEFASNLEAMCAQVPLNLSLNREHKSTRLPIPKVTDLQGIGNVSLPKILRCAVCHYQTGNKAHMRRHSLSVHTAMKPYSCYICGQGFTRTEKVKRHFLRVHPGELYDCQRLKIQTSDANAILSDSSLSPDSRTPSPQVTSSNDDFEEGQIPNQQHPANKLGTKPSSPYHLINSEKAFDCVHCDFTTNRRDHLHTHMNEHGQLRCPHCSFSSHDLETYMFHLKGCIRRERVNANTLICDYCEDVITDQSALFSHLLYVHGIEVYQCEFCAYSTDSRDSFLYHYDCHLNGLINATHNSMNNSEAADFYSCSVCSFQTQYRFIMKNHTGFHTGNVKQCGVNGCSFRSVLGMSLEVHRQICHSSALGTHDYNFISCQEHTGYIKSQQLNSHRCGSCFLTFNSLHSLRQHLSSCEMGQLEKSVYESEESSLC